MWWSWLCAILKAQSKNAALLLAKDVAAKMELGRYRTDSIFLVSRAEVLPDDLSIRRA